MKKIYISSYSNEHQKFKNTLIEYGKHKKIFLINNSVESDFNFLDTSDGNELIRNIKVKILKNSEIAIFLIGKESSTRKIIDWELRASMITFGMLKKCGIIVVYLPEISEEYGDKFPRSILPEILYKNISNPNCHIIETTWNRINKEAGHLEKLLNLALCYRYISNYKLDKNIKTKNETKYSMFETRL